jgi:hypothetical protein|tara:strand:- start:156 stop:734 length:579 start_codon:yes stop_codon:yes gene_type:complete
MNKDLLGKISFRLATKADEPLVKEFCASQNYSNNTSLEKMKWEWCLKNGAWTIALYENKIISIAGIHDLPEVGWNCYRCLFRGAQLPGYTLGTGRDIFKTGIHLSHLLNLQIDWAPNSADLFISTNINDDGGKSQRMNDTMMPLLAKRGIWTLDRQMELYNVPQNLWRINVTRYKEERNLSLNNDKNTDQKL